MPDDYTTIQLGDETLRVRWQPEPSMGAVTFDFGDVSGPLVREPAQTLAYPTTGRQMAFTVRLEGIATQGEGAADNLARKLHNLAVELAKPSNLLIMMPRGRAMPTTWRVFRNPPFPGTFTWASDRRNTALVPIVLNVAPWAQGASVTTALGTELETPNVVDWTVGGTRPAELELTVTRAFTSSGLQTFMAALIPDTFDLADVLLLAKDAGEENWDNYTATSGYTNASNNTKLCTDTTWRALWWTDQVQPAGRYSLVAKCRVQTGGKGWLAQCRTGNTQSAPSVAVSDTDWRFVRLGDWASDGLTPPRIIGKCREAANGILVDWVLAVPLDLGSPVYFHCATASVERLRLAWLEAEMQLTSGGWRSARRYMSGAGLEAVGDARLLVAAIDANGNLRRPAVSLEETHVPLYDNVVPNLEA